MNISFSFLKKYLRIKFNSNYSNINSEPKFNNYYKITNRDAVFSLEKFNIYSDGIITSRLLLSLYLLYAVMPGCMRSIKFVTRSLGKYVTAKSLRPFPFSNGQARGSISLVM